MENKITGLSNGQQILEKLIEGNQRYVSLKQVYPNQTPEHRKKLCKGQSPSAVILGCSDSRIPPEIIFDQGLGDLFVVRVAGNIIDTAVLGSIEYAVSELHTPLVMVLGHSQCGAVKATVAGNNLEGHLSDLTAAILPAMNSIQNRTKNIVDNTAKANVKMVSEQLKQSTPILSRCIQDNRLTVVSAFYNLDTGLVEIL